MKMSMESTEKGFLRKSLPRMDIATGLSGFSLLSRITEYSGERVAAVVDFKDAPHYLALEALAQAGAYHVRFLCHFERQAVLLMIRSCRLPARNTLQGRFDLSGYLRSRSASVFAYEMTASKIGETVIEGDFIFTAVDYNSSLREDLLRKHYEERWTSLRNG